MTQVFTPRIEDWAARVRESFARQRPTPISRKSAPITASVRPTFSFDWSAMIASTAAPSMATNANSTARIPRYFPMTYSWRRSCRVRIGKTVFSSSSR